MEIQKLSSDVVDQIAAGEVVERPAHLLKELVENSLDAGATSVDVDFDDGGRFVRVTDNGKGIQNEDLPLVFARHATSKIVKADDLWNLHSFGFRGEALASISSVSKTQISSGYRDGDEAFKITSEFGKVSKVLPTGSLQGTSVQVEDLFANVPAREKFLKSASAETTQIKNVIKALALANPEVEFKLRQKKQLIFFFKKASSFLERTQDVLGVKPLYLAEGNHEGIQVEIAFSDPANVVRTSKQIWIYVQGRWVQDRGIQAAVMQAYRQLLMHGEFPQCVVKLTCPTDFVDVNIHPAKSQVKFLRNKDVFQVVHYALRGQLELAPWLKEMGKTKKELAPSIDSSTQSSFSQASFGKTSFQQKPSVFEFRSPSTQQTPKVTISDLEIAANVSNDESAFEPNNNFWSRLQVLGQLDLTYILCQSESSMVLVDQHAAHERVAFERLMQDWKAKKISVQNLLIPLTMNMDEAALEALLAFTGELKDMGIEVERSGPAQLSIGCLPAIMKEAGVVKAVDMMSRQISENGGSFAFEEAIGDIFATMACHSVVRAGQALSKEQMQDLLKQMDEFPLSGFCPHGRNVSVETSFSQIERDFGRIT